MAEDQAVSWFKSDTFINTMLAVVVIFCGGVLVFSSSEETVNIEVPPLSGQS